MKVIGFHRLSFERWCELVMFQFVFSVSWGSYVLDMSLIFASKQTSCQDQAFVLIDTAVIVTVITFPQEQFLSIFIFWCVTFPLYFYPTAFKKCIFTH